MTPDPRSCIQITKLSQNFMHVVQGNSHATKVFGNFIKEGANRVISDQANALNQ